MAGEAPVAWLRELAARITAFEVDVTALERRRDLLAAEATKVDIAAAEQARISGIETVIQPAADSIVTAAERLQRAITELGDAYACLDTAVNALYQKWPAAVPHAPFYRFTLMDVKHRLAGAMQYAAGNAFGRVAEFARSYGERTVPLAEGVKRALANYIRDLRTVPLPAPKQLRETIDV